MSMTDPIADLLTRIRNASLVEHESVEIPASRLKARIVKILKEQGYIQSFSLIREMNHIKIKVYLKYEDNGKCVIRHIKRLSRPGLRRYAGYRKLTRPLEGAGTVIVSTSKGVLTANQARAQQI